MPQVRPATRSLTPPVPAIWIAGIGAGLLAAALWGGGAVVARHLVTQKLAPLDLAFLRYAGCFPVALLLYLNGYGTVLAGLGWWRFLILLLLAGPPYHLLVLSGYQFAGAGGGTLIICGLLPVFALALTAGHCNRLCWCSRLTSSALICLGLVVLALATPGMAGTTATVTPKGLVIFALAALAWAILNQLVTRWNVDALGLTIALGLSAPVFLPLYFVMLGEVSLPSAPLPELLLQMAYHGVGVAFGATFLFFLAVQRAGPQVASNLQALAPAFATGLGVLLLGEPFTVGTALAALTIVVGIAMATASIGPVS
ncbi:MAG: DMT family transporter [Hyphomicrobiaceae bacterium]|nr:DMT family transporter [Hyphomicrobiaceae bacterium]